MAWPASADRSDPPSPLPAVRLRRHGEFVRLWAAQGISAVGSQVTLLALPLIAILVLHASALQVALLSVAATAPALALGVLGGVWIDRVRRRPVMIAADVGRAVMLASVPLAYALQVLSLPHLYLVALVNGSLSVLFEIASQAYLPSVVHRGQLIEANAKFEANRVVAQATGPAAAGGLLAVVTAPLALAADAASFLASAGLLGSLRRPEPPPPAPDGDSAKRRGLREAARYVFTHRYLRPLLLAHANANLTLGLVWSIVIVYAVREFGLTATVVGLVLSLGQLGGLVGAIFGARIADRLGIGRAVVAGFFLFGPATLLFAIAPKEAAIAFLAAGLMLENLARAIYGICATAVRQATVPNHLQARVTGFLTTVGTGAFPLGATIGGTLASTTGLRGAMAVGALVSFLAFVPVALSPMRSLRSLTDVHDNPAAAQG